MKFYLSWKFHGLKTLIIVTFSTFLASWHQSVESLSSTSSNIFLPLTWLVIKALALSMIVVFFCSQGWFIISLAEICLSGLTFWHLWMKSLASSVILLNKLGFSLRSESAQVDQSFSDHVVLLHMSFQVSVFHQGLIKALAMSQMASLFQERTLVLFPNCFLWSIF